MVRPENIVRAPSIPFSGWRANSASIFGMATKTGNHWCGFQSLLNRMPMMNTTKSPSSDAVKRPGCTLRTDFS